MTSNRINNSEGEEINNIIQTFNELCDANIDQILNATIPEVRGFFDQALDIVYELLDTCKDKGGEESFKDLEQYISICLKSCKESSIELRKENMELSNSLEIGNHNQNPELN